MRTGSNRWLRQSVRKATKRRFFARTVEIRTLAAGRAAAIALANREFDEPIVLPNGRKLVTLRDAATFITNADCVEKLENRGAPKVSQM